MVALTTIATEHGEAVIGVAGPGQILGVAANALGGCSDVFIAFGASVASLTIGDGVHSCQGEAFFGMLHQEVLTRFPIGGRMAIIAGGAQPAQVMIGVAVGAGCSDVIKQEVMVAVFAFYLAVGAIKAKAGFGVIKGQFSPQFVP